MFLGLDAQSIVARTARSPECLCDSANYTSKGLCVPRITSCKPISLEDSPPAILASGRSIQPWLETSISLGNAFAEPRFLERDVMLFHIKPYNFFGLGARLMSGPSGGRHAARTPIETSNVVQKNGGVRFGLVVVLISGGWRSADHSASEYSNGIQQKGG